MLENLGKREKSLIMVAVVSCLLFASLNQTIVGNALPKISAALQGMNYFHWVFTVFMLTSSVTSMIIGRLSDIFGRRPIFLIGIGIFLFGSFLCGTSTTMIQLIFYRGIQGLGAGMLMTTSFAAVGDLFPPRERGRWQGVLSATFGFSSILGPSLGGYIIDFYDWHWIFWIFLPFGLLAFILILLLFPKKAKSGKQPIDYLGAFFLVSTITPLLLSFTWGGKTFSWGSWQIISLIIVFIASLFTFIKVEKRAKLPILPLYLFKNSIFLLSNVILFCMGFGMFGSIIYSPFLIQNVMKLSAIESSFLLIGQTLTMSLTIIVTGQIVSRTGKYKKLALCGGIIMSTGLFLLSFADANTPKEAVFLYLVIVGTGLGIMYQIFVLTAQNSVSQRYLGVTTSAAQLFRQMGGTIGVSILGLIMSYAEQHNTSLSGSLQYVFLFSGIILLVGTILIFFVKEIPLRSTNKDNEESPSPSVSDQELVN